MKTTCVIDNYNYAEYICEAVDSALAQTIPFEQIIIVDDGSSDDSVQIVQERYADVSQIQIISKENGGQLSALLEGIRHAEGEIICFLDADDRYKANYHEEIQKFYQSHVDCEILFCEEERFNESSVIDQRPHYPSTRSFGSMQALSLLSTYPWIGNVTAALSAKASLLKKLIDYPYLSDWVIRADDVLLHGIDVLGGHKYYLQKLLIEYRVHGSNAHHEMNNAVSYKKERHAKLYRLFQWLIENHIQDQRLKEIALLHLECKLSNGLSLYALLRKWQALPYALSLVWSESIDLSLNKRINRWMIVLLAFGFNLQGSTRRYI